MPTTLQGLWVLCVFLCVCVCVCVCLCALIFLPSKTLK